MNAYNNLPTDAFLQTFGKDVFASRVRAFNPNSALQIVGIMTAGVAAVLLAAFLTLYPFGAENAAQAQAIMLEKSDRADSVLPGACRGQAWGAWSADCAAAISGNGSVRKINFVTVESASTSPNTTVLSRVQTNG
ncbi:hypothetical protein [Roseibium sp.]|uniref:hypothetical protein n=1 Tax=Roseibium sp. TaxID=1936156 RepID=UPI003A979574